MRFFVEQYANFRADNGHKLTAGDKETLREEAYTSLDKDGNGAIDVFELKCWLTRHYIKLWSDSSSNALSDETVAAH